MFKILSQQFSSELNGMQTPSHRYKHPFLMYLTTKISFPILFTLLNFLAFTHVFASSDISILFPTNSCTPNPEFIGWDRFRKSVVRVKIKICMDNNMIDFYKKKLGMSLNHTHRNFVTISDRTKPKRTMVRQVYIESQFAQQLKHRALLLLCLTI